MSHQLQLQSTRKKHVQQTVNVSEVQMKSGEWINIWHCKVVISIEVFKKFILKKVGGNHYTEYAIHTYAFCLLKTNMQEI
jgi:hypothetical protein